MSKALQDVRIRAAGQMESSVRQAARDRADAKYLKQGNRVNGRTVTVTELWLEELRQTDVGSDQNRGEAVLSASSKIKNVDSATIVDFMHWLLDSGAWRSFTYPNGEHFEFLEREFDYFCAQIDVDPNLVNEAARAVNDNALLVAMAEASLTTNGWNPHDVEHEVRPQGGRAPGPDRSKRRSVDEITATYPSLRPWLDKYALTGDRWSPPLGGKKLHESKRVRVAVGKGSTTSAAMVRQRFEVNGGQDTDLAELIARRLVEKDLADDVYRHLDAAKRKERRVRTTKAKK